LIKNQKKDTNTKVIVGYFYGIDACCAWNLISLHLTNDHRYKNSIPLKSDTLHREVKGACFLQNSSEPSMWKQPTNIHQYLNYLTALKCEGIRLEESLVNRSTNRTFPTDSQPFRKLPWKSKGFHFKSTLTAHRF
jgi:hypothetical protein